MIYDMLMLQRTTSNAGRVLSRRNSSQASLCHRDTAGRSRPRFLAGSAKRTDNSTSPPSVSASLPDSSSSRGATGKALGLALACLLTFQQGLDVSLAHADVNEANLSPYERRKLENERRKEMLRSLREKAEKGASSVDTSPAPTPQATYVAPKPSVPTIPKETPKVEPPPAPKDDIVKMPQFSPPKVELPSFSAPKLPSFGEGNDRSDDGDAKSLSIPSFSAPKVDMPKLPSFGGDARDGGDALKMPDIKAPSLPSFSAPKLPSFGGNDALKMPDMPKFSFGSGDDNTVKPLPPPPPPTVSAPKPLPPQPPTVPAPKPPPTVTNPPPKFTRPNVVMPDAAPRSNQGDTLEQWRKQQKKDLADRQKREVKAAKKSRKRGAMPTWLAEFFLLTILGGFGFAIIALGDQMSALYRKVDRFLLGLFSSQK